MMCCHLNRTRTVYYGGECDCGALPTPPPPPPPIRVARSGHTRSGSFISDPLKKIGSEISRKNQTFVRAISSVIFTRNYLFHFFFLITTTRSLCESNDATRRYDRNMTRAVPDVSLYGGVGVATKINQLSSSNTEYEVIRLKTLQVAPTILYLTVVTTTVGRAVVVVGRYRPKICFLVRSPFF